MDRTRVKRHYLACIYKHDDLPAYTVTIKSSDTTFPEDNIENMKLQRSISVDSYKRASIYQICYLLFRKFTIYQTKEAVADRNKGIFTHVVKDLDWIINIINTEFDFHVGSRRCMEMRNKDALEKYTSDMTATFHYAR